MPAAPEVPRARSTAANVVALVVLAASVIAAVLLIRQWDELATPIRDRVAEIPSLVAAEQQGAATGSESLLILVTDEADRVGAIALIAAADEEPATLTVIPSNVFELLPGYGDFPLRDTVLFEGPELARVAIANALGVRIDRVAALTGERLGAASISPLTIELGEPVLVSDGESLIQLASAGSRLYDGPLVARLMVDQGESGPVAWVERQAAIWQALIDAVGGDTLIAERFVGTGPAASTLIRAAVAEPVVSLIPVTPVAVAGAADGFQLVQQDVARFVEGRLAHLALATGERPRVEVLNGNGEILATRSVVEALVAAGFHIVKTDNAENFDFAETVVISQGRDNLDASENAAGTLGVRMVQLEAAAPSGVVDVSIIVGQDIATLRS